MSEEVAGGGTTSTNDHWAGREIIIVERGGKTGDGQMTKKRMDVHTIVGPGGG